MELECLVVTLLVCVGQRLSSGAGVDAEADVDANVVDSPKSIWTGDDSTVDKMVDFTGVMSQAV